MWIVIKEGFYSVVESKDNPDILQVRTRVRKDLDRLKTLMGWKFKTYSDVGTDYPYRIFIPKREWVNAMVKFGEAIDYKNFKDSTDRKRSTVYYNVWTDLMGLETRPSQYNRYANLFVQAPEYESYMALDIDDDPEPEKTEEDEINDFILDELKKERKEYKPMTYHYQPFESFGGVVFNSRGKVLLVKPSKGFNRTAWTFPKGRMDKGETSDETALREVREESGVVAEVVERIPGVFEGTTSKTGYFVMKYVKKDPKGFHWETEAVTWVSPRKAFKLIAQSENSYVRRRDFAVLSEAMAMRKNLLTTNKGKGNALH